MEVAVCAHRRPAKPSRRMIFEIGIEVFGNASEFGFGGDADALVADGD